MPEVREFAALRYVPERVGNVAKVVAPPYDVIDPALRSRLLQVSPYNIAHVMLGQTGVTDYAARGRLLRGWVEEGVLARDPQMGIYVCEQEFCVEGSEQPLLRRGFIGLLWLEELGKCVFPHEETAQGPKQDRLALLQACRAHACQVFGLYSDEQRIAERLLQDFPCGPPLLELTDEAEVMHRLWQVNRGEIIAELGGLLAGKPLVIADGHHRYETALMYREQMQRQHPDAGPKAPWNFVPCYFANIEADGLCILPSHRVVRGLEPRHLEYLASGADGALWIEAMPAEAGPSAEVLRELFAPGRAGQPASRCACLYTGRDRRLLLHLADTDKRPPALALGEITNSALGLPDADCELSIVHDIARACELVDSGQYQAAVLLPAFSVREVFSLALSGVRLPPKSTYFYPKLLTGTLVYDIAAADRWGP